MKSKIVVSAINFTEGGPLSILMECLETLDKQFSDDYEVIALVNNKKLFHYSKINFYEYPKSKKSWLFRLFYEYYKFNTLSRMLEPTLWLSLHDITPNVKANCRAVYCHNPSPFIHFSLRYLFFEPKFFAFNLFYKYLYGINIHQNQYVIVQQEWIKNQFIKMYNVKNVIVAHPESQMEDTTQNTRSGNSKIIFIYPAFPRVFKNFEVICRAAEMLQNEGFFNLSFLLTIDGSETRYAKMIFRKFNHVSLINFLGIQPKSKLIELYNRADCLIFPSKLETWGMPISEFKNFKKPMLLADLPYAHETAGQYDMVKYFPVDSPAILAKHIKSVMQHNINYDHPQDQDLGINHLQSWYRLFKLLLNSNEEKTTNVLG